MIPLPSMCWGLEGFGKRVSEDAALVGEGDHSAGGELDDLNVGLTTVLAPDERREAANLVPILIDEPLGGSLHRMIEPAQLTAYWTLLLRAQFDPQAVIAGKS